MVQGTEDITMSLTHLPSETLFQIVRLLGNVHDLNALVQTSRLLYQKLNKRLYQFDKEEKEQLLYDWTPHQYKGPRISSRILLENQDDLDTDATLYIATDGNVDANALYFAIRWNHLRTAEVLIRHGSAVKSPGESWLCMSRDEEIPGRGW